MSESVSADMLPYCLAHDEWLIMKLYMYIGYHDANNVSNFGGDQVTQLNFKKRYNIFYAVLLAWRTIAMTRPLVLRLLVCDHSHRLLQYGRPYQPRHSPSSKLLIN